MKDLTNKIYLNDINFKVKNTPFPIEQSKPLIIDETKYLN